MYFVILCAVAVIYYLIYARRFRKNALEGFEYSAKTSSHELYEGDEFYLYESIVNAKDMPMPNIRVETQLPYGLDFCLYDGESARRANRNRVESIFVLKPNNTVDRRWRIIAKKRGVYYLGSVHVSVSDLFGIIKIYTHYDMEKGHSNRITVLPKTIDIEKCFAPATDPYGDVTTNFNLLSDPLIWAGAREYVGGDPINKINWKSTARLHKPMVNIDEYNEKHSYDIIFNIQSQARENEGTVPQNTAISEMGISLCASIIDQSCTKGISVRLLANSVNEDNDGEYFISREYKDRGDLIHAMRMLAEMRSEISCRFERMLDKLLAEDILSKNRSIIIISPYVDKETADFTSALVDKGIDASIFVTSHRSTAIELPRSVPVFYKTYK